MLQAVYIFILNARLKIKSMKLSLLVIAASSATELEPAKDIVYGKFEYKTVASASIACRFKI